MRLYQTNNAFTSAVNEVVARSKNNSEHDEAVVAAHSIDSAGSMADLTAADEHLRNLAEAIGPAQSDVLGNNDLTHEML